MADRSGWLSDSLYKHPVRVISRHLNHLVLILSGHVHRPLLFQSPTWTRLSFALNCHCFLSNWILIVLVKSLNWKSVAQIVGRLVDALLQVRLRIVMKLVDSLDHFVNLRQILRLRFVDSLALDLFELIQGVVHIVSMVPTSRMDRARLIWAGQERVRKDLGGWGLICYDRVHEVERNLGTCIRGLTTHAIGWHLNDCLRCYKSHSRLHLIFDWREEVVRSEVRRLFVATLLFIRHLGAYLEKALAFGPCVARFIKEGSQRLL